MAIGIVADPLRDRKLVAPNSPSEIAAASPAAAVSGRRRWGHVIVAHARAGDGPERGRGLVQVGVDAAQHGQHGAHDERDGDEGLADGHQPPRAAPVDRRHVERDQQAEADRHGGRGDRQHQPGVEQPPGPAGRR